MKSQTQFCTRQTGKIVGTKKGSTGKGGHIDGVRIYTGVGDVALFKMYLTSRLTPPISVYNPLPDPSSYGIALRYLTSVYTFTSGAYLPKLPTAGYISPFVYLPLRVYPPPCVEPSPREYLAVMCAYCE